MHEAVGVLREKLIAVLGEDPLMLHDYEYEVEHRRQRERGSETNLLEFRSERAAGRSSLVVFSSAAVSVTASATASVTDLVQTELLPDSLLLFHGCSIRVVACY